MEFQPKTEPFSLMPSILNSIGPSVSSIPNPQINLSKRKSRRSFSLKEKLEIVKLIENGANKTQVARQRNITLDSVRTIWKNKNKTKEEFWKRDPNAKRSRDGKYQSLETLLFDWFRQQRNRNIPLSSTVLKAKASDFATLNGIANFTASNGWFEGWKKRFNLKFSKISGEAAAAPLEEINTWLLNKWPILKAAYTSRDIFNAAETGLYFKMLPERIYGLNEKQIMAYKQAKMRITILACANMLGTDKKKLLVIGKSPRPRNFPKSHQTLPVTYTYQRKGQMTGEIYENWLRSWDEELGNEKRRILLLVDSGSAHVTVPRLKNITVEFFPTNVTAVQQPCDQGIFKSLKTLYRRFLIEKLLTGLESNGKLMNLNLLDAVYLISMAWQSVTRTVIANAFKLSKLCQEEIENNLDSDFNTQNEALFAELHSKLFIERSSEDSMDNYINVDENIPIHELDDNNTVGAHTLKQEELISSDEGSELLDSEPNISVQNLNILTLLSGVRDWIGQHEDRNNLHSHVTAIERAVLDDKITKRVQSNSFLKQNK